MTKQIRIGAQMSRAAAIVAANPGCSMLFVAAKLHIGAARGTNCALGYNPVHRAIKAGLIVARSGKGNAYALYAPCDAPYDGIPIIVTRHGQLIGSIGC